MRDPAASRDPLLLVPPPLLFAVCFALGLLLGRAGGNRIARALALPGIGTGAGGLAIRVAGIVALALGAALALTALGRFARARTTLVPHGEPAALVVAGPYRLTRNPMYVALTLLYLGAALTLGAGAPLLMLPLALAALHWRVIPYEERSLERAFGPAFEDYRRRVRRWL